MFTGLIEEVGKIVAINHNSVKIEAGFSKDLKLGESVAVNGTCLTVTQTQNTVFSADISPETFNVTSWKLKKAGDLVNLERAMLLNSRLDGHLVYGHVDTISKISKVEPINDYIFITIELPSKYKNLVVYKGAITIDGISLTIAEVGEESFKIALIPTTLNHTSIKNLKSGDFVNIEFDIIAKYIEKNLSIYDNKPKLSMDFLKENGFL